MKRTVASCLNTVSRSINSHSGRGMRSHSTIAASTRGSSRAVSTWAICAMNASGAIA